MALAEAVSITIAPPLSPSPQNGNHEIHETTVLSTFPRFDVVSAAPNDHHYKSNEGSLTSGAQKKIMREWKQLEKDLPDTIFVRAYEDKINLLRAVIVGASSTPYHDGLYFFDILIPNNYPTKPPEVYYWSYGLRINPNLYATGKVCLSLLNTWRGKKREIWLPTESTILQVLVSIQGLVLNEKPFYNEPGTGKPGGKWNVLDKQSIAYSEDAFILSRKTMIYLLRKPPVHFEEFVKCFFKERAVVILSACEDYMNGKVKVGYYNTNSKAALRNVAVSGKFNGQMKVLIPLIVTALNNVGASLGRFADYKVVVNEAAPKIKKEKVKKETKKKYKNNNKGFVKKLWEKFTMVFKSEKKTVKTTATGAITV